MASALTCYTIGLDFVTSSNQYFPCGTSNSTTTGAQVCCYAGDVCMEDGICHYLHPVTHGSGYYLGGCTDPKWQDPSCPKACTSEYGADVTWNNSTAQWNCCASSEGHLNCEEPSNFTLQAPSPAELSTIRQINTPVPSPMSTSHIGSVTFNNYASTGLSSLDGTSSNMTSVGPSAYSNHSSTVITSSSSRSVISTSSVNTVTSKAISSTQPMATSASGTSSAPSSSSSSSSGAASTSHAQFALAILALFPAVLPALA